MLRPLAKSDAVVGVLGNEALTADRSDWSWVSAASESWEEREEAEEEAEEAEVVEALRGRGLVVEAAVLVGGGGLRVVVGFGVVVAGEGLV